MSANQSSNCVESFPLKIGISCIKVFANKECPYIVLVHHQEFLVVLMGKVLWTVIVVCILYDAGPLSVVLLLLGHVDINHPIPWL